MQLWVDVRLRGRLNSCATVMDEKDIAARVIKQLKERGDMDGYTLLQGTSVSVTELRPVIERMVDAGTIRFRGTLQGQGLAEAWYTIRPSGSMA